MIKKFSFIITILILLIICNSGLSQLYHIQNYGKDEGLPQLQVFSIHQDCYGFMWFGTGGGLARYDGQEFLYFDHSNGLPDVEIQTMCGDNNKNLWLGTALGVCRINLNNINSPEVDSVIIFPDKRIHHLYFEKQEENLWIVIRNEGMFIYRNGQIKKILDIKGGVNFITNDSENNIWTAINNKIIQCDVNGNIIKQFEIDVRGKPVALFQNPEGKYLFFTEYDVYNFDKITGELSYSVFESKKNPTRQINDVYMDNNKVLWIGGDDGLWKMATNSVINITSKNGLVGDYVNCISEDREGNIWIGTYLSGVSKILSTSVISYGRKSGLDFDCVNCIKPLRNGSVLVSTDNGIVQFDNYEIQYPSWAKSLNKKDVWVSLEDKKGTIWAGTYDGLYRFDKKNNNYFLSNVYLEDRVIISLFEDNMGCIWIGCDGKVYSFKDNFLREIDEFKGIQLDNIWAIYESSDSTKWLCTTTGLISKKNEVYKFYSEKDGIQGKSVYVVFEDNNKNIWIGTPIGLHRFNNNRFELFDKMEDFRGHVVTDIVSDHKGYMWICTDKGVNKFDGKNVIEKFTNVDGLIGEEFTTDNSAFLDLNGKLWFGVFGGLTIYDPHFKSGKNVPPKIYITGMTANLNQVDSAPWQLMENAELPYLRNIISFKYTGLSYRDEKGVNYQYILEGFDQDWSEWSNKRENRYTNLDPGTYVFRVKAKSSLGVESKEESTFTFSILKPFWQEVWFMSLVLIGLISLVYYAINYKLKSIKRRTLWLEEKISQRTEELVLAKEYVENVIENAGDIIITVDEKGSVLKWNKEAENIFGYTKSEIINKNIKSLDKRGDGFKFSNLLKNVKKSGPIKQKEIKKRLKDGGKADLLLSVSHLINPFGDGGGYTLVLSDIREKNRLQQALLNREKLLGGIDALQKLLGTLSHYINNSISAISGMAQLSAMDKQFTEKLIDIAFTQTTRIKAVLKGLSHLVDELNLKSADYAGEKEVMFDIEDEISNFIEELKKKGK